MNRLEGEYLILSQYSYGVVFDIIKDYVEKDEQGCLHGSVNLYNHFDSCGDSLYRYENQLISLYKNISLATRLDLKEVVIDISKINQMVLELVFTENLSSNEEES